MGLTRRCGERSKNSGRSRSAIGAILTPTTPKPGAQDNLATVLQDELLSTKRLAERWKRADKTLANDRSLGRGCRYILLGRHVRYRLSDVLAYEARFTQLIGPDQEISQ